MQVVGHPDLHGWDGTNPPLIGDIVAAVIQEFGRSNGGVTTSGRDQASTVWGGPIAQQPSGFSGAPPAAGAFGLGNPPVSHPASGATGGAASAKGYTNMTSTAQRTGGEVQTRRTRPPVHHTPIPDIPDTFSELQGLSTEKLNRLLGDESARQALLLGMTNVVRMKDLRTDVRKGNVETARLTLAKQDAASVLREEGEKIKAELKALQTSYEGVPLRLRVAKPSQVVHFLARHEVGSSRSCQTLCWLVPWVRQLHVRNSSGTTEKHHLFVRTQHFSLVESPKAR